MRSRKETASASGSLGELSEESIAKLVRRANTSGKKKPESALIGKNEVGPQRDLENEACNIDALAREELTDSDWEDGPNPTGGHQVTIELNETQGSTRKKRGRRASVEDKEVAELVHKANLLCLIARGRLVDRACDDSLTQVGDQSN